MILVLSGCGGSEADANEHADELCKCLTDAGLDGSISVMKLSDYRYLNDLAEQMEEKVPKCALKIFREMDKELENLNKSEKKEKFKARKKELPYCEGCFQ